MAFEKGLPGLFWFTTPNIVALGIFAVLGPKIREKFPEGYTLPQYILRRLGSKKLHWLYLVPFFFGQLIAITFNIFAGGSLISLITGIPIVVVMPILALIALLYTLVSGLKASIVTDFVQVLLILIAIGFIVPWAVTAAGGASTISGGFGGKSGNFSNLFDPSVAFSFGIVTSIGLISQTIADQQYWQRTFALKKGQISSAFIFGAVLFAVVPVGLGLLGFLGANPALGITLPAGIDSSMIGVVAIRELLPRWAVLLFVIALLGGLSSTVDSGISAASALWATDVDYYLKMARRKSMDQAIGKDSADGKVAHAKALDDSAIKEVRLAMIVITGLGLLVAYAAHLIAGFGLGQLFLLSISIAAAISVPTVLSLFWDKLSANGVFWGVLLAIVIGMPLFIYANTVQNAVLIVSSSLLMILISTVFCLLVRKKT